MDMVFIFLFFYILCGFYVFCSMREHFLNILLSLEFMVLSIFLLFNILLVWGSYFYSLIYLIITACEGALGLSILIIMGRSYGGDYFKGFNFIY